MYFFHVAARNRFVFLLSLATFLPPGTHRMRLSLAVSSTLVLFVAACSAADKTPAADTGGAPAVDAAPAAAVTPEVTITSPADGDSVSQPFTVKLGAAGVEVIAATGTSEPGKGHHHLVLDGDVPSETAALPKPPLVYHLGTGATEKVMDSLTPGSHRIIAVFAGGDHVPMTSVKRDTITVIVRKK
jgi:hypothetical protein